MARTDEHVHPALEAHDPQHFTVSGGPAFFTADGHWLTQEQQNEFWASVADLGAKFGLHCGAGLIECDEDGNVAPG